MARGQIIVETAQLDTAAGKVEELSKNYFDEYTKLYGLITELQNAWAGTDNTAYTNQINEFKDDFQRMKSLMDDYAQFLRETAAKYRAVQEEIKSGAQKLQVNA